MAFSGFRDWLKRLYYKKSPYITVKAL